MQQKQENNLIDSTFKFLCNFPTIINEWGDYHVVNKTCRTSQRWMSQRLQDPVIYAMHASTPTASHLFSLKKIAVVLSHREVNRPRFFYSSTQICNSDAIELDSGYILYSLSFSSVPTMLFFCVVTV